MKSLMLKLLTIGAASSLAFASVDVDSKVLKFQKDRINGNKRVKLNSIELSNKVALPNLKGWNAYIYDLNLNFGNREVNMKDILFSNGKFIAPDLINIDTKESLKESVKPSLTIEYYNKEHFIAGTKGAKNKIVLFSDPLCPFCMDFVPDVLKFVEKHKSEFEVYYYHLPLLSLHPASETLSKAMIVAHNKGIKDVIYNTYMADFDKYFTEQERDAQKILNGFNAVIKSSITLDDIKSKKVLEHYEADLKSAEHLMVSGTPTIYLNGELDKKKRAYLEVVKGD